MRINCADIASVLDGFNLEVLKNAEIKNSVVNKISEIYENSLSLIGMPDKIIFVFNDVADFKLDKKTAKKIVYDISCTSQMTELINQLKACAVIKDKLNFDRENYSVTLKVHDGFIVQTDLAQSKTYINKKFYYDIEEQDLSDCYCEFVNNNSVYILFKRRRFLSYIGLSAPYLKIISERKIPEYKNKNSVYMIFNNKELIYKSNA